MEQEEDRKYKKVLCIAFLVYGILGVSAKKDFNIPWNVFSVFIIYGALGTWIVAAIYVGTLRMIKFLSSKGFLLKLLAILCFPLTVLGIWISGLIFSIVEFVALLKGRKRKNKNGREEATQELISKQNQEKYHILVEKYFKYRNQRANTFVIAYAVVLIVVIFFLAETERVYFNIGMVMICSFILIIIFCNHRNKKIDFEITAVLTEKCNVEEFQQILRESLELDIKGVKKIYMDRLVLSRLILKQPVEAEYFTSLRGKGTVKAFYLNLSIYKIMQGKGREVIEKQYLKRIDHMDAQVLEIWIGYMANMDAKELFCQVKRVESMKLNTIQKVYLEYLKIRSAYYENDSIALKTSREYVIENGGTLPLVKKVRDFVERGI